MKQSLSCLCVLALCAACDANGNSSDSHNTTGGASAAGGSQAQGGGGGIAAGSGNGGAGGITTGGTGGAAAGSTAGGAAGSAGAAGAAGAAGSAGSAGGPTVVHGGSSNKAICAPGATYGNPLTGMGSVVSISAPTMGPATYFAFIEGPVWVAGLGKVFFSDNASQPQERIWSLAPPSTTPAIFLEMSGSNGMAVDNDDKLIVADQRNHRITRLDPANAASMPQVVVPAGSYTPNDLIVRSDGSIYFTDPNSAGKGFYRVSPSGELTGPLTQVGAPNGIELNADETLLYVGDVNNKTVYSFSLAADGTVNTGSMATFVTTTGSTVDGMATDCAGNLYVGTQGGVEVYSPTKTFIGTVPTGESSNCTFGGTDRKTLYVTSRSVLKAVTLAVPGLPD